MHLKDAELCLFQVDHFTFTADADLHVKVVQLNREDPLNISAASHLAPHGPVRVIVTLVTGPHLFFLCDSRPKVSLLCRHFLTERYFSLKVVQCGNSRWRQSRVRESEDVTCNQVSTQSVESGATVAQVSTMSLVIYLIVTDRQGLVTAYLSDWPILSLSRIGIVRQPCVICWNNLCQRCLQRLPRQTMQHTVYSSMYFSHASV